MNKCFRFYFELNKSRARFYKKNEYSKKIAHPYMVVMVLALYLLLMMKIDYKVDDDVKEGVRKDGGGER